MTLLEEIFTYAIEQKASDIHLVSDAPAMYRIDGELVPMKDGKLDQKEIQSLINVLTVKEQREALIEEGEVDFSCSLKNMCRMRVNIYRQRTGYTMILRLLSKEIPTPEELLIPQSVLDLTERKSGLVIVSGTTGSGRSTTIASLISVIAQKHAKSIITIENPIEYIYPQYKSVINQREVGTDTKSVSSALHSALKQDSDIIMIGEMRDLDTIATAISAAETGHLVFAILDTRTAVASIERMTELFQPYQQRQMRVRLANVLECVITQQLLSKEGDAGRIAAYEVLMVDTEIRNFIQNNKKNQLISIMQNGKKEGIQKMDDNILELYMKCRISAKNAIKAAQDPMEMEKNVTVI